MTKNDLIELPINESLTEELESIANLGTEVEDGGFFAQAADQPIANSIREVFQLLGQPALPITGLYERFELWLVPHRVSIIRRSGFAEPTSVGIEVQYQNDGMTCSVISLFPSFSYVVQGRLGLDFSGAGILSSNGQIAPANELGISDVSGLSIGGLTIAAAAGAGLKGSTHLELRLSSTVSTPLISATGIGASRCEWRFDKKDVPLFGRTIETWAVVLLPKGQRQLNYTIRFYIVTRTIFVPTRRQSGWQKIVCLLNQ